MKSHVSTDTFWNTRIVSHNNTNTQTQPENFQKISRSVKHPVHTCWCLKLWDFSLIILLHQQKQYFGMWQQSLSSKKTTGSPKITSHIMPLSLYLGATSKNSLINWLVLGDAMYTSTAIVTIMSVHPSVSVGHIHSIQTCTVSAFSLQTFSASFLSQQRTTTSGLTLASTASNQHQHLLPASNKFIHNWSLSIRYHCRTM